MSPENSAQAVTSLVAGQATNWAHGSGTLYSSGARRITGAIVHDDSQNSARTVHRNPLYDNGKWH